MDDTPIHIRQVSISSLNESINLVSSYKDETLDVMSKKAVALLHEIHEDDKKQ